MKHLPFNNVSQHKELHMNTNLKAQPVDAEIIEDTTAAEEMTLNELAFVGGGAGSDTFQ